MARPSTDFTCHFEPPAYYPIAPAFENGLNFHYRPDARNHRSPTTIPSLNDAKPVCDELF